MAKQPDGNTTVSSFAGNEDRLVQLKIRTEKMEHWSRRIGMLLKILFSFLWLLLIGGLALMAWSATRNPGVVIDAIRMPSSQAEGEPSGDAITGMIRSRLTEMRRLTNQRSKNGALVADWAADYRVPIPQTGTTVGEIASTLRRWLGSDTRVGGALGRAGEINTLTINIAAHGRPMRHWVRSNADLSVLVEEAAEEIYSRTDPYLFAIYVRVHPTANRERESTDRMVHLATQGANRMERAQGMNGFAVNLIELYGRCAEAIPILHAARRQDPQLSDVHRNLSNAHNCLGRDQEAADSTAAAITVSQRHERATDSQQFVRNRLWDMDNLAGSYGSYLTRLALLEARELWGDGDRSRQRASALARLRQVGESRAVLRRHCILQSWTANTCERSGGAWYVRFEQAWALEDWREAVRLLRVSNRHYGTHPYTRQQLAAQTRPLEAMALAWSGDAVAARRILRASPQGCYLCARGRAVVEEAAGNSGESDRWFRQAVDLAPRLPFAYVEWGEARLRRGEASAALALFDQATAHGPEFADGHKGRGDALAGLDRHQEAAQSYAAAAQRAPRWGALHLRWAWTLARIGRAVEAREKACAAAGMDLSRRDRELLRRLTGSRRFTC